MKTFARLMLIPSLLVSFVFVAIGFLIEPIIAGFQAGRALAKLTVGGED